MKLLATFATIKEKTLAALAWMKQRPRNMLIAVLAALAVIVALALFIKFVIPSLMAIAFLGWVVFGDDIKAIFAANLTQPQTLADDAVCWEVANFMFATFLSANNALTGYVGDLSTVNDIFNGADYRGRYNGAPMLKLHLLRSQREITPGNLTFIKNVVQSKAVARLRDGYLAGNAWAINAAADIPLVKVAAIIASDTYIHLDILLVNTPASVRAARMSDMPAPPPFVDGTDPLFRRGGS